MRILTRPSKSFLFEVAEREIKKIKSGIGVDAGCADFKNRPIFKTEKYYGLDMQLDLIRRGLDKHREENTFGIYGDLTNLDMLAANSVDLMVATNVLHPDFSLPALESLCRLTAPKGRFLVQLNMDEVFDQGIDILKKHFNDVNIIYYKNGLSRSYEKSLEESGNGWLGFHPLANSKVGKIISLVLSRLEYLTCHFRFLNNQAFVICQNKKNQDVKQNFDLSSQTLISDRIYLTLTNH